MVVPVTCFDPEIFFDNDVYFVKKWSIKCIHDLIQKNKKYQNNFVEHLIWQELSVNCLFPNAIL